MESTGLHLYVGELEHKIMKTMISCNRSCVRLMHLVLDRHSELVVQMYDCACKEPIHDSKHA